ncbi:HTH-type transcriptional regulator AcrR [Mycobacteroides salmoniphilum]|uniref:HTH-type transcriptional regulator AcrR n=2 Tax=Mycobacteroides salmoniphilum TaxID=404941 RepID=A0A4R8SHN2_9MYCO|nr:HTH-type transcriptional regulator AcrR [Mycobacteroides salmoniphilum]TEA05485.1 HTH-type transcriptional regulator AcrR [Mycobacteroides salmoniphilum]
MSTGRVKESPGTPDRKTPLANTHPVDSHPKRVRMSAKQREEQLLDIAEELFTQRGFENVSIEDIARTAGVTRPVIYQHFRSLQGVFVACVARARREQEQRTLERVEAAGDGFSELIRAGGAAYFDLIEADPDRFILLFSSSTSVHGEIGDQLNVLRTGTIEVIASTVRRQRPDVKPEAALAFAYAASGIGEQLGRWWLTKPTMSKRRILDYYTSAVEGAFDGIVAMRYRR